MRKKSERNCYALTKRYEDQVGDYQRRTNTDYCILRQTTQTYSAPYGLTRVDKSNPASFAGATVVPASCSKDGPTGVRVEMMKEANGVL